MRRMRFRPSAVIPAALPAELRGIQKGHAVRRTENWIPLSLKVRAAGMTKGAQ